MTTAFLVCDERRNFITGLSYHHPWAMVYDREKAIRLARGNEDLVYEMNEGQAHEMYDKGRITK